MLREATQKVGVVPNAAYRHFADRDELLAAVSTAAMRELAAPSLSPRVSVSGHVYDIATGRVTTVLNARHPQLAVNN